MSVSSLIPCFPCLRPTVMRVQETERASRASSLVEQAMSISAQELLREVRSFKHFCYFLLFLLLSPFFSSCAED